MFTTSHGILKRHTSAANV